MNIHYQESLLNDYSNYVAVTEQAQPKTAPSAPSIPSRTLEVASATKPTTTYVKADCSYEKELIKKLTETNAVLKKRLEACEGKLASIYKECAAKQKEVITKYEESLKDCQDKLSSCGGTVNVKVDTPPVVNLGSPTSSRVAPIIPTGTGSGSSETSKSIKKQTKEWLPLLLGVTGLAVIIWKPFKKV